ncbi:gagpol and env protein precursor, partial [Aphelenchoides avenae]
MYERRVMNCPDEVKVRMLAEYVVGEARRAYKCVLAADAHITFPQLCKQLRAMLVDSTCTGQILRMKRFDELRIFKNQSYSSFILLLESQVLEAYGDSDETTIDRMKTKVLLANLRERDLCMQVETELSKLKHDEWKFPVVKRLALAYERHASGVDKWHSQGKRQFNGDAGGSKQQGSEQKLNADGESGGSSENQQSQARPADASGGSRGSVECFYCRQKGHRKFECPKRLNGGTSANFVPTGANTGGNAKFGNFSPPTCYGCGQQGHIKTKCPNEGSSNATASSKGAAKKSTRAASKPADASPAMGLSDGFSNMCSKTPTVAEFSQDVVGKPCLAPILVNGVEANALFDLGSQVNIISKACIRDVLRKGHAACGKLPALFGHPPGVNIRDASGTPMKFLGIAQCRIQVDSNDAAEVHKFLVQENTNFDVVLGTPVLAASRKWCERTKEILDKLCDEVGHQAALNCGLKETKVVLVGEGVSFSAADDDGQLYATIVNETEKPMALIKGKEVAKCIAADKVCIEDGDSGVESSDGLAMATGYNPGAAKRAAEIFQLVLEGSLGKSVLEENKRQVLSLFERFSDCFALTDFELGTTHLVEHDIELKEVRKKDGSIRMCVDYRKLNKVIKLSQYPMPNINVMLQSLVGKKFFTTCDLHSGYWQIPLAPKAKEFTAFSTMGGHWEFN